MTPTKKKRWETICTYVGGGLTALATVVSLQAPNLAVAMANGAKAGVAGSIVGLILAKIVLALVKTTPETDSATARSAENTSNG